MLVAAGDRLLLAGWCCCDDIFMMFSDLQTVAYTFRYSLWLKVECWTVEQSPETFLVIGCCYYFCQHRGRTDSQRENRTHTVVVTNECCCCWDQVIGLFTDIKPNRAAACRHCTPLWQCCNQHRIHSLADVAGTRDGRGMFHLPPSCRLCNNAVSW